MSVHPEKAMSIPKRSSSISTFLNNCLIMVVSNLFSAIASRSSSRLEINLTVGELGHKFRDLLAVCTMTITYNEHLF